MLTAPPGTTFGDLKRLDLALEVTCQRCGNVQRLDGLSIGISHRQIARARFRCARLVGGTACGGIGLPTLRLAREFAGSAGRLARARRNV